MPITGNTGGVQYNVPHELYPGDPTYLYVWPLLDLLGINPQEAGQHIKNYLLGNQSNDIVQQALSAAKAVNLLPQTYQDVLTGTGGFEKQIGTPAQQAYDFMLGNVAPMQAQQLKQTQGASRGFGAGSKVLDVSAELAAAPLRTALMQSAISGPASGIQGLTAGNQAYNNWQRQFAANQSVQASMSALRDLLSFLSGGEMMLKSGDSGGGSMTNYQPGINASTSGKGGGGGGGGDLGAPTDNDPFAPPSAADPRGGIFWRNENEEAQRALWAQQTNDALSNSYPPGGFGAGGGYLNTPGGM